MRRAEVTSALLVTLAALVGIAATCAALAVIVAAVNLLYGVAGCRAKRRVEAPAARGSRPRRGRAVHVSESPAARPV